MSAALSETRSPRGLTETAQEMRSRSLLQCALDRVDAGTVLVDSWTLLHLTLALTVYGWKLYPLVDVYVARALMPVRERPRREVALPQRWPEKLQELRDEFNFPRQI